MLVESMFLFESLFSAIWKIGMSICRIDTVQQLFLWDYKTKQSRVINFPQTVPKYKDLVRFPVKISVLPSYDK